MAAFYPYDVEGYGATDDAHVTTLSGLDLGGRLAGDVLTSILYANPDGTTHPALAQGCTAPTAGKEISIDRLRALGVAVGGGNGFGEGEGGEGDGSGFGDGFGDSPYVHPNPSRHALPSLGAAHLAVDPRAAAKADVRSYNDRIRSQGPVLDSAPSAARLAALAGAAPRYGASGVVAGATPCECAAIQKQARQRSALKSTDNENYARFLRDFHARDDRWFSDGDRVAYEFYELPNASTLAIMLTRAGVISPPRFPLPVLAGRDSPCACSLIGPELVHRISLFLGSDMERFAFARLPISERNLGSAMARFNARVVQHFEADDELHRRGDAFVGRAQAMAGADVGAGSWEYQPLPRREPSRGRVTGLIGEDAGVNENRAAVAHNIAASYGYEMVNGILQR